MHSKHTKLRIIGGTWRGRKLDVPVTEGLRPTHDRIRETLFNWLMNKIDGLRCLDPFAGSGALAFEALSRGASHAVMIEKNHVLSQALQNNAELLGVRDKVSVIEGDALSQLLRLALPFDLLFLDPPFDRDWLNQVWQQCVDLNLLSEQAWVYVEYPVKRALKPPLGFDCYREKHTKHVAYALYRRSKK